MKLENGMHTNVCMPFSNFIFLGGGGKPWVRDAPPTVIYIIDFMVIGENFNEKAENNTTLSYKSKSQFIVSNDQIKTDNSGRR